MKIVNTTTTNIFSSIRQSYCELVNWSI